MHHFKTPIIIVIAGLFLITTGQNLLAQDVNAFNDSLNRYCVTCHNEALKTANLLLDKVNLNDLGEDAEVWEKIIGKLSLRAMPPVGLPRPDEDFYVSFLSHLKTELNRISDENPNSGRETATHRLNRTEYTNAIRDLLGVDFDSTAMLPPDNSGGFDNLGDLLTVSQVLLEKYMAAARMVTRLAIGDPNTGVDSHHYTVDPRLLQDERMSEDLPFGSRGGLAVDHRFPVDGIYELQVGLQKLGVGSGMIAGLAKPNRLDFRVDGERVELLTIGGDNIGIGLGREGSDTLPPDPAQSIYERTADEALKVRFPMTAGSHKVQVAFLRERYAWEGVVVPPPNYENYNTARIEVPYERVWHEPAVANVTIDGPFEVQGVGDTASREKIFVCMPKNKRDEEPCARQILENQARLAYRRPVNDDDVAPLLGLYREGRKNGDTFEAGVRKSLEGLLMSSEFLFRIEPDPDGVQPGDNYELSDIALASRLSFMLWSSIPDDELLTLAEHGKLSNPKVMEDQVQRMLEDDRSTSLVSNFAEQWLLIRNLPSAHKNSDVFRSFDEELRNAFHEEVKLFVGSIFNEDRSIMDLFEADYTYLNERLAKHYGIKGVYGNRFRKVKVGEDQRGLLARAGILSITSYPNRNSTVLRGKWVLENILAAPPPPPPEDIPPLEDAKGAEGEVLTLRERMEIHPANPACAVCHNQMDPIGFGLENYNAIGQWRELDEGKPINAKGRLPSGVEFEGPAELQRALLNTPEVFAGAFTQKLMTYALGRPLEHYDMPAVRKILNQAEQNNYKFSSIVLGIINSLPFQYRTAG
jgi:hypothetical protein